MDTPLIEQVRALLHSSPDQSVEQRRDIFRGLTVSEHLSDRSVGATMNLLGELTAVNIEVPDLKVQPKGWVWRSEALTDLLNGLHRRVTAIRTELDRKIPDGGTT